MGFHHFVPSIIFGYGEDPGVGNGARHRQRGSQARNANSALRVVPRKCGTEVGGGIPPPNGETVELFDGSNLVVGSCRVDILDGKVINRNDKPCVVCS